MAPLLFITAVVSWGLLATILVISNYIYIYIYNELRKFPLKNVHEGTLYTYCILRSLFIRFEHSLDWVESLIIGVHYWHNASLTACSLSTLVTPQYNPTMCNRTSCAQVQELP